MPDDAPVTRGYLGIDDVFAGCPPGRQRGVLIGLHQARIARDIGGEEFLALAPKMPVRTGPPPFGACPTDALRIRRDFLESFLDKPMIANHKSELKRTLGGVGPQVTLVPIPEVAAPTVLM